MGFDRKMKYEDPFRYVDRLDSTTALANTAEKYLFPFHLPEYFCAYCLGMLMTHSRRAKSEEKLLRNSLFLLENSTLARNNIL